MTLRLTHTEVTSRSESRANLNPAVTVLPLPVARARAPVTVVRVDIQVLCHDAPRGGSETLGGSVVTVTDRGSPDLDLGFKFSAGGRTRRARGRRRASDDHVPGGPAQAGHRVTP